MAKTHAASNTINNGSSRINGPSYPSLNSSIRYTHLTRIKTTANNKNPKNNFILCVNARAPCFLTNRTTYSTNSTTKIASVTTCSTNPAMETRTPVLLPEPACVAERAPPAAWRRRETMSQGMKNQMKKEGLKWERGRERWLILAGRRRKGLVLSGGWLVLGKGRLTFS